MAAKHFTDLQCWRLADALRAKIIAMCARPHVARHFKFCDSALDSAASVCRNISEGFTRFKSAYIVQFFTYGLASLAEIQDHLIEAEARGFIDAAEKRRLWEPLRARQGHDAKLHEAASP